MKSIRLNQVTKSYNGEVIIEKLSLTIPAGAFFALLGPSGSGKTTILRLIGGFETPDEGRIYLGNEDITDQPINQRRINTVFQNYALFPHMNVFDNVAYSLALKKVEPEVIEQRVIRILKAVHLEGHIYKAISQLSGGQKQRVALARAMINEPEVLLLDEPLAALDMKLRERMLLELIDLQTKVKTTFIYITHDQFEALTVADYIAILNKDGEIEQIGTPKEIYEFPASTFVARFVGTTNILRGTLVQYEGQTVFEVENLGSFAVDDPDSLVEQCMANESHSRSSCMVFLSIRPEKLCINKHRLEDFSNSLVGFVKSIVYHGRSTQYNVRLANDQLFAVFEQNEEHFPRETIAEGDQVYLYWQKENALLLSR